MLSLPKEARSLSGLSSRTKRQILLSALFGIASLSVLGFASARRSGSVASPSPAHLCNSCSLKEAGQTPPATDVSVCLDVAVVNAGDSFQVLPSTPLSQAKSGGYWQASHGKFSEDGFVYQAPSFHPPRGLDRVTYTAPDGEVLTLWIAVQGGTPASSTVQGEGYLEGSDATAGTMQRILSEQRIADNRLNGLPDDTPNQDDDVPVQIVAQTLPVANANEVKAAEQLDSFSETITDSALLIPDNQVPTKLATVTAYEVPVTSELSTGNTLMFRPLLNDKPGTPKPPAPKPGKVCGPFNTADHGYTPPSGKCSGPKWVYGRVYTLPPKYTNWSSRGNLELNLTAAMVADIKKIFNVNLTAGVKFTVNYKSREVFWRQEQYNDYYGCVNGKYKYLYSQLCSTNYGTFVYDPSWLSAWFGHPKDGQPDWPRGHYTCQDIYKK